MYIPSYKKKSDTNPTTIAVPPKNCAVFKRPSILITNRYKCN